jgi:hypothetical protein
MTKNLTCAAVAAACFLAGSASAATITFNHTLDATSGKTTPYLNTAGVYVETFDMPDGTCGLTGAGIAPPGMLPGAITGGPLSFAKGQQGTVAAPPYNDTSCYAYAPGSLGSLPDVSSVPLPAGVTAGQVLASITVDYSYVIATLTGGQYLNYFGLYYGSVDPYNMVEFFDENGDPVDVVYGSEVLARCAPACSPGSQTSDGTNQYVNLLLDPGETFKSLRITTWGTAIEVDNLAIGVGVVGQVPEPASLALVGLGLLGLAAVRRRHPR